MFCCLIDPELVKAVRIAEMLPYSSVESAVAALGRDLTFAESIWLKYTGHVPDSCLYFCNIIFLFVVFNCVPVPLAVLDGLNIQALKKYKIQPGVHYTAAEVLSCWRSVMKTFITVVGPLQLSSYPLVKVMNWKSGPFVSPFGFHGYCASIPAWTCHDFGCNVQCSL